MHSGLCEQYPKSLGIWLPVSHAPSCIVTTNPSKTGLNPLILSWCWWNLLTTANQIAQIGSCDRSRIHVPDLGGTGVWPGKNSFHQNCKHFDNIAVYLIISLKSKWKRSQWKIWMPGYDTFFYQFQKGNLQWNSWICKMIDYLKGSIVKFHLNLENALEK